MNARLTGALLGVGALGLLVAPGAAFAQAPSCADTTMFPNPIFLTGSTAFEPVVQAMAAQLNNRTAGSGKVTLIYQTGGASCTGAANVRNQTSLTGNAHYYTAPVGSAGQSTCSLDIAPPKADVAISDVFYDTCGAGARPSSMGDFLGPAQAMLIVVPTIGVVQSPNPPPPAISAEQAQMVWGCGANGMVSPWSVETAILQRGGASGTQNVIARHINVLAFGFHGTTVAGGSNGMIATLEQMTFNGTSQTVTIADPGRAIGFLSADLYDNNRDKLTSVAFRAYQQNQAYYADSGPGTFDKRNVRDGHYMPWGYEHMFVRLDSTTGQPSAAAKTFIDWVQSNTTTAANAPNFDPIAVETTAHVIPLCAMKVQRASDGGYLSPYTPLDSCHCFFEATLANGTAPTGCVPCTDSNTCSGGTSCHHGFCE